MKLTWYGTAALVLEEDGYLIAVDPFVGMPAGVSDIQRYHSDRAAALTEVDAILVTHGHFDHIYDIPALFWDKPINIYATKTPCSTLNQHGVPENQLHIIAPGGSFRLGPFEISVYQGRHCKFDAGVIKKTVFKKATAQHPKTLIKLLRLNSAYPENGETVFYEIRANGKRIHLMGSMGMDESVVYPTAADALILPFQGTGSPSQTVQPIIAALQPKRILLDHYDDAFPPMSSQVQTDEFVIKTNGKGILTEAMQVGKTVEI